MFGLGGGQGGCEGRIEVFVKFDVKKRLFKKKNLKKSCCFFVFFLGGGVCEVRWGVRMDFNEGLKFL